MTYMSTQRRMPRRVRRARPMQGALGSWVDDLFDWKDQASGDPSDTQQCLDVANQQAAPLDAKVYDLAQNWQPTGNYLPADILTAVSSVMPLVVQAQSALDQAMAEGTSAQDAIGQARALLFTQGSRAVDYTDAAKQALTQGADAVAAPDFKQWVLSTMQAASGGMVAASVSSCMRPWWLTAIAVFQSAFDKAWAVVRAIAGVIVDVGKTVVKVAAALPDLAELAMWAAIVGGAYYLFINLSNYKKSGKSFF